MSMIEGDAQITIEFQLQTRRMLDLEKQEYTPWRTVFTSTEDDVIVERQRHIDSGYKIERLRVLRVITIEEIWKT